MRDLGGAPFVVLLILGLILVSSLASLGLWLGRSNRTQGLEERLRAAREAEAGERLLEGRVEARPGQAVAAPEGGEEVVAYASWTSERIEPSRLPAFRTLDLELRAAPFDLVTPEGRFAVDGTPLGISDLVEIAFPGDRLVAVEDGDRVSVLGTVTGGPGGAGVHGDFILVTATADEWMAALGDGPYPSLPEGW